MKETLAQVYSCEFCEISINTFFYSTPLVAASDNFTRNCATQLFPKKTGNIFSSFIAGRNLSILVKRKVVLRH